MAQEDRSAFAKVCIKHMKRGEEAPQWMGRAVMAIKPWNDAELTLQHAISIALEEAYNAGLRGDTIEPIDFVDIYRKRNASIDNDQGGITGVRVTRTRTPAVVDADGVEPRPVRITRVSRSAPAPAAPTRITRISRS